MECLDNNTLEFEEQSRNLFVLCLGFTCWELHVLDMKLFCVCMDFAHVCYSFI